GDFVDAIPEFERVERGIRGFDTSRLTEAGLSDLARFYDRYAEVLDAVGRRAEAIAIRERAIKLNPRDVSSLEGLNVAYQVQGGTADRERVRAMLLEVPAGRAYVWLQDGWLAAGSGRWASAESLFVLAVHDAPNLSNAWDGLIRVRIHTAQFDKAEEAVEASRGGGLAPLAADVYQSFIELRRGTKARAREVFARIPPETQLHDPVLDGMLTETRRELGPARP